MPSRARSARARSPGPARAIRTVCNMSEKAGAASETKKSHVVLADVLSDSSIRYIGFIAACIGKLSVVVSALLLSGPCWMLISLCGPHMPNLFVPVLMAGGLRLALVFCNLVQQALEDGVLERWETFGIIARFTCDVFITAHAVFPQPIFNTIVGGSFTSGDAARAAHMRASRWVWRQTVGFPAEYFAAVAVLVYIFARTKQPGLNAIYRAEGSSLVPWHCCKYCHEYLLDCICRTHANASDQFPPGNGSLVRPSFGKWTLVLCDLLLMVADYK